MASHSMLLDLPQELQLQILENVFTPFRLTFVELDMRDADANCDHISRHGLPPSTLALLTVSKRFYSTARAAFRRNFTGELDLTSCKPNNFIKSFTYHSLFDDHVDSEAISLIRKVSLNPDNAAENHLLQEIAIPFETLPNLKTIDLWVSMALVRDREFQMSDLTLDFFDDLPDPIFTTREVLYSQRALKIQRTAALKGLKILCDDYRRPPYFLPLHVFAERGVKVNVLVASYLSKWIGSESRLIDFKTYFRSVVTTFEIAGDAESGKELRKLSTVILQEQPKQVDYARCRREGCTTGNTVWSMSCCGFAVDYEDI